MLRNELKCESERARLNNTKLLIDSLEQQALNSAKQGYNAASILFNDPVEFESWFNTQGCTVTVKLSSFGTAYSLTW